MRPILYHSDEKLFNNNGIGVLTDATMCKVTEVLDGEYELEMKYPLDGQFFGDIKLRSLILAKPNKTDRPQPFRVYRITKPLRGVVTVYGEHISYDLAGIPVNAFVAADAPAAMAAIKANSAVENPFTFSTDKATDATMKIETPRSAKACVFGQSGSLLDTYTGDLFFDRFSVSLLASRGSDNGVKIAYGKNLTDLKQEENIASAYTGIYPYALDINGTLHTLPEKILRAEGDFGFERIKEIDLSAVFMSATGETIEITEESLRAAAEAYMSTRKFGVPTISIDVSFVQLEDTEEYKNIASLESVSLGDRVTVEFSRLGVSVASRCSKTVFDCLTERYDNVTIGEVKKTIADNFVDIPSKESVREEISTSRSAVLQKLKEATELLNGANGGAFEILDENGDGINDAWILRSSDNLKFIKANLGGIGLTQDGGESYLIAITPDGINAEAINVEELLARNIYLEGLFYSENDVFMEPGYEEAKAIAEELVSPGAIPEDDYALYDYNSNGRIDTGDASLAAQSAQGKASLAEWSGAQKTTFLVEINPSDPAHVLRLRGTNMWGKTVDKYFGINTPFMGSDYIDELDYVLKSFVPSFAELSQKVAELESRIAELESA